MNTQASNTHRQRRTIARPLAAFFALAVTVFGAREAAAELPLAKVKGWDISMDGRLNTFISFSQGETQPVGVPNWAGGVEDRDATTGNISMTRIRTGFVTSILGFNLVKALTPEFKVTGRFGMWAGISSERKGGSNPPDAREVYFKFEGPWGGVLAGRDLEIFERGAIMLDYDIVHAYGLGHPCGVRNASGGACGLAGHGLLFPGYNAGVIYNTPDLAGFKLSLGVYDPSIVSERQYERTTLPKVEAELVYRLPEYFHVFGEGMWERIGKNDNKNQNPDAYGVAAGAGVTLGPVAVGGAFYTGQGLGLYVPMENSPLFSDELGVLRKSHGWVALASVKVVDKPTYDTKIGGGVGISYLDRSKTLKPDGTELEPEPFLSLNIPKQQRGITAGVYQGFNKTIVLALEYFRGDYQWYDSLDAATGARKHNKQGVNFINVGGTVYW